MWQDAVKEKLFWGFLLFLSIFLVFAMPSINNFFRDVHLEPPATPDAVRSTIGYSSCQDTEMEEINAETQKHLLSTGGLLVNVKNESMEQLAFMTDSEYLQFTRLFGGKGDLLVTFSECKTDTSTGKPVGYWECRMRTPCKQFVSNDGIIDGYKRVVGKISYRQTANGNYSMISCEERVKSHDTSSSCESDLG